MQQEDMGVGAGAPPIASSAEALLDAQRNAATAWMEAIGHLPHSYEGELHGLVEDAFKAGRQSASAAAPDLLEALKDIDKYIGFFARAEQSERTARIQRVARAAIAKATSPSPAA